MDEELVSLIQLQGFLAKAKELVQIEGLVGGHRGTVDDMLTDCITMVLDEIERKKAKEF